MKIIRFTSNTQKTNSDDIKINDFIDKTKLSNRSINALHGAGIHTIKSLLLLDRERILKLPNIGTKSFDEINICIDKLCYLNENIDASVEKQQPDFFYDKTGILREDIPIKNLPLSNRSLNQLSNAGYCNASQLLNLTFENLRSIKKLGTKSANEILQVIKTLSFKTYIENQTLSNHNLNWFEIRIQEMEQFFMNELNAELNEIHPLYKKAQKAIAKCESNDDVLFLLKDNSCAIVHLTYSRRNIKDFPQYKLFADLASAMCYMKEQFLTNFPIFDEIANHIPIDKEYFLQELIPILTKAKEENTEPKIEDIFSLSYIREIMKKKILDFLSNFRFGVAEGEIASLFPESILNTQIIKSLLHEMKNENTIVITDKIKIKRMTVLEFIKTITNDRKRNIFELRLHGSTLEEIGQKFKITRERIRQIQVKILKMKPDLEEDKYIELYETYNFSYQDFIYIFDEEEYVYHYLACACSKRGSHELNEIIEDSSFSVEVRKQAEKVVYKNYLLINGERIYKNRLSLVDYVIRTYFKDEATFDDFMKCYTLFLVENGLENEKTFEINYTTYSNRLAESKKVLWVSGRKFRYYDMENYDFTDFWDELALESYVDVEYSTLKIFREHLPLMHRYDIRNEYELHNLLKKMYDKTSENNIDLKRMPTISFGNANRDNQVLNMLIQLAPVSIDELAEAYEKEYGVLIAVIKANYFRNVNEYYHNGFFDISKQPLPSEQYARMKELLTGDYYDIADVKWMYQREFPNQPLENINPYTLKNLGFMVYTSCIISRRFPSVTKYFEHLLTEKDLIDFADFPFGVTRNITFTVTLDKLKSQYEIIEYKPKKYIHISRLKNSSIDESLIKDYCTSAFRFITDDNYFTIKSLKGSGFVHELDDLGFDDVFYASLLTEDSEHFSYQRLGSRNTKLFRKGTENISLLSFIRYIIEQETASNIYKLETMLIEKYGILIDRHKIISIVKDSSLYYDSIMEKIYINYETYFEEI